MNDMKRQFIDDINDVIQRRNDLDAKSPDWSKIPVYKLVGAVKDYVISNFENAHLIFERFIGMFRNHQEQLNQLNDRLSVLETQGGL